MRRLANGLGHAAFWSILWASRALNSAGNHRQVFAAIRSRGVFACAAIW
jgi:hypothetical protein